MNSVYFKLTEDYRYLELIEQYSNPNIVYELHMFFNRREDDYFHNPAYKSGNWDGFTKFFRTNRLRSGLWVELLNFEKVTGFKVHIEGLDEYFDHNIDKRNVLEFIDKLLDGSPLSKEEHYEGLRYYQEDAIFLALEYKIMCSEIATSGGKTLIGYVFFQYLLQIKKVIDRDHKMLFIVPRVGLVKQTVQEFTEKYNNGKYPFKFMAMGGAKFKFKQKDYDEADIIITTYQSLGRKKADFFKKIKAIIVDEAHTSINKTISSAIDKCIHNEYRFGLSGTLVINEKFANYIRLQAVTGPVLHRVPASELISGGFSADVFINTIKLKYNHPNISDYNNLLNLYEQAKEARDNDVYFNIDPYKNIDEIIDAIYNTEKQIIIDSDVRKKFIFNLVNQLNGNTLILFNNIKDNYGKNIFQMFNDAGTPAYYIDGNVKDNIRSNYQDELEEHTNAVLVASYGTFSTGINLKNIKYIIFAESYKSPHLIRQSIGRGMRILEIMDKYYVTIIDIVDMFGKYSKKHSYLRNAIYKDQGFKQEIYTKDLT